VGSSASSSRLSSSASLLRVRAAPLVSENFQQAGHAPGARVRQHDRFWRRGNSGRVSAWRRGIVLVFGLREHAIDGIDEFDELRCFAVARMRDFHSEVRVNVRWIAAENDDAVGASTTASSIL